VFSGGWAVLRDRLRAAGVAADDVSDLDATWVGDHVLAQRRAGLLTGPVVFVGHSRGGRLSLHLAERLRREGVRVDLILTADTCKPPAVPVNVGRAVNLYLTKNRLYPARALRPAPDSQTVIENVALDQPGSPFEPRRLHHLNFTDSQEVQDYLFGRVMEVMGAVGGIRANGEARRAREGKESAVDGGAGAGR
jgi:pimeloyl-ACP methyl ester carboxylesterase